jgi:hypothetical protein
LFPLCIAQQNFDSSLFHISKMRLNIISIGLLATTTLANDAIYPRRFLNNLKINPDHSENKHNNKNNNHHHNNRNQTQGNAANGVSSAASASSLVSLPSVVSAANVASAVGAVSSVIAASSVNIASTATAVGTQVSVDSSLPTLPSVVTAANFHPSSTSAQTATQAAIDNQAQSLTIPWQIMNATSPASQTLILKALATGSPQSSSAAVSPLGVLSILAVPSKAQMMEPVVTGAGTGDTPDAMMQIAPNKVSTGAPSVMMQIEPTVVAAGSGFITVTQTVTATVVSLNIRIS